MKTYTKNPMDYYNDVMKVIDEKTKNSLPLTYYDFFQYIDSAIFCLTNGCNGKTHQENFFKKFPQFDLEKITLIMEEHGGYCDCEIMMNVVFGDEDFSKELQTKKLPIKDMK